MGYKLNEEGWQQMEDIAQKLACLPEGESVVLKDTRGALDKWRYVIYAWLYETDQKIKFKLIRRSPESLEIRRKVDLHATISVDDRIESFVSCNLIEVEDESEATARIRAAIQRDEITSDQGVRSLQEWSRIQGRAK